MPVVETKRFEYTLSFTGKAQFVGDTRTKSSAAPVIVHFWFMTAFSGGVATKLEFVPPSRKTSLDASSASVNDVLLFAPIVLLRVFIFVPLIF